MTRETRALIERASPILREAAKKTSLLGAIAWPVEVEERFFAAKAARLPDPKYEIDRATIEARLETLRELERSIAVNDEITGWLARTTHSFIDGNRLLLALGTREFHLISKELYGDSEGSHATPSEVSLTWFAYPDAARPMTMNPPVAPKGEFTDAADYRRNFPDGRIGSNPGLSTAEAGKRLFDAAVKDLAVDYKAFASS